MFEQFRSIEVVGPPVNQAVAVYAPLAEYAKVRNEPHPFALNDIAAATGAKAPIIRPAQSVTNGNGSGSKML